MEGLKDINIDDFVSDKLFDNSQNPKDNDNATGNPQTAVSNAASQTTSEALKHRNKASSIDNPVNSVNKEPYLYRAGRRGINGSLDQFDVQLNIIRDVYFSEPDNNQGLCFSKTPSVLNILLHFTKDKLVVDDGVMYCRYRTVDEWHEATTRLGEDIFTTSYLAAYDLYRGQTSRTRFLWRPYLDVETNDVNILFGKEISEVHAHLEGLVIELRTQLAFIDELSFPSRS